MYLRKVNCGPNFRLILAYRYGCQCQLAVDLAGINQ